jgi:DNA transformation protein and related proteins
VAVSRHLRDDVLEQHTALDALRPRRMFGGVGLYCDEVFFGLIAGDVL